LPLLGLPIFVYIHVFHIWRYVLKFLCLCQHMKNHKLWHVIPKIPRLEDYKLVASLGYVAKPWLKPINSMTKKYTLNDFSPLRWILPALWARICSLLKNVPRTLQENAHSPLLDVKLAGKLIALQNFLYPYCISCTPSQFGLSVIKNMLTSPNKIVRLLSFVVLWTFLYFML
jgi:hypothetical protein